MITYRHDSQRPERFKVLLQGVPARSNRGWFGYCSITLFRLDNQWALFDTGQYSDRDELYKALRMVDVEPNQIRFVVLSHLHFDHVLNLPIFPNAEVFLSKQEVDYAARVTRGSLQDTAILDSWSTLLESRHVELVDGSLQIDRDLYLKVLPGHTPGCMALLRSGSTKTVLCGDIVKNGWEAITRRPLSTGADDQQASESIRYLVENADVLIPGHDRALRMVDNGIDYLTSFDWTVEGNFYPRPLREKLLVLALKAGLVSDREPA